MKSEGTINTLLSPKQIKNVFSLRSPKQIKNIFSLRHLLQLGVLPALIRFPRPPGIPRKPRCHGTRHWRGGSWHGTGRTHGQSSHEHQRTIIIGAFFGIRQCGIGFVDPNELAGRVVVLIISGDIWVQHSRQPPVGGLDLLTCGAHLDPENLVERSLRCNVGRGCRSLRRGGAGSSWYTQLPEMNAFRDGIGLVDGWLCAHERSRATAKRCESH